LAFVLVTGLAMLSCAAEERASVPVQRGSGQRAPSEVAATIATPAAEFRPSEGQLAVLAYADAVDGTADRTVTRCPGCALAMDGSAEHAFELGGYELHFCSATCRDHFHEHPQAGVDALGEARQAAAAAAGN